jgi:hypothetical protein
MKLKYELGFVAAVMLLGALGLAAAGQPPGPAALPLSQLMNPPRNSGLTVSPVFEGWEPNADGTFSLYFGYFNRNLQEELDIPLGPNNHFAPGAEDRGQPTHFGPRRHKQIFSVVVPKDFGTKTLTWVLSIRGDTQQVPGSLRPEQQIDAHHDTQSKNTPPKLELPPSQTVPFPQALALTATVSDDGLPKARPSAAAPGSVEAIQRGLNVRWAKYRGPGVVTFRDAVTAVKDGKASTTATFSAPGEYTLLAVADDGSILGTAQGQHVPGYACCWTTGTLTVKVESTPTK